MQDNTVQCTHNLTLLRCLLFSHAIVNSEVRHFRRAWINIFSRGFIFEAKGTRMQMRFVKAQL